MSHKKLLIPIILLLFISEIKITYAGLPLGAMAWELIRETISEVASDIIRDFLRDNVTKEEILVLRSRVSDLESQLLSVKEKGYNPSDFSSVEQTVIRLIRIVNAMESRFSLLEDRVTALEKRVTALEQDIPFVKQTIAQWNGEGLQKRYSISTNRKSTSYINVGKIFFRIANVNVNDVLNIRYLSDPRSKKIGKISYNQGCVAYLNQSTYYKSKKWVKITYQNIQGWVNSEFLQKDENPNCFNFYKVINVDYNDVLNMRQSPTFHSNKVGTILPNGCCILKLDESFQSRGKWFMVRYNGVIGWVNSRYLVQQTIGVCGSC